MEVSYNVSNKVFEPHSYTGPSIHPSFAFGALAVSTSFT